MLFDKLKNRLDNRILLFALIGVANNGAINHYAIAAHLQW